MQCCESGMIYSIPDQDPAQTFKEFRIQEKVPDLDPTSIMLNNIRKLLGNNF